MPNLPYVSRSENIWVGCFESGRFQDGRFKSVQRCICSSAEQCKRKQGFMHSANFEHVILCRPGSGSDCKIHVSAFTLLSLNASSSMDYYLLVFLDKSSSYYAPRRSRATGSLWYKRLICRIVTNFLLVSDFPFEDSYRYDLRRV